MIDYIRKTSDNNLQIVGEHTKTELPWTFQKFINAALKSQLTDLRSREKVTRAVFGFSAKMPIYIDSDHLYLCIRSYRSDDSLYINLHAISGHKREQGVVKVLFHTDHELVIKEKYAFDSQLEKARLVMEFLRNEKVFSYL